MLACSRQRDVEQPPLLLHLKIALRLFFLHKFGGEFEHGRARPGWKMSPAQPQDEDVRKLESLGAVDRHQLHGVFREVFFEVNVAVEFVKEPKILDEIAEALVVAFLFPFFYELNESLQIL